MSSPTVIPDVASLRDLLGKTLGPSEWVEVTQERIDHFATATGDHQWIHTDPERAKRESPFGGTIAHGYLTLALAPAMLTRALVIESAPTVVNAGIEKMKLSTPVPAGSRVRLSTEVKKLREMPGGRGMRVTFGLAIELEGARRAALTADVVLVYLEA